MPEDRRIFTDLTVDENLEVGPPGQRRAAPRPGRRERLFRLFPNLAEMRGRRASQMSGGEQQMLAIARTLMGNPDAILLDEPSEGLAPVIVQMMAEAILAMKAEGVAVLLSEQNWAFAAGDQRPGLRDRARRDPLRGHHGGAVARRGAARRLSRCVATQFYPRGLEGPEGMIGKASANPEGVREALARARARRACARRGGMGKDGSR